MKKTLLAAILAVAAGPALAHTGAGPAHGFTAGLTHPIFGLDHLLAMLAVGLWSGFVIPNRVWAGAAAFLSAMAVGALLSWGGIGLPLVETGIVASVVLFGLLTLLAVQGQNAHITQASLGVIAVFALFHGHAHATEAHGNAVAYLGGFLFATTGLHIAGIGIARTVAGSRTAQRAMGAAIAGAGLWLALG